MEILAGILVLFLVSVFYTTMLKKTRLENKEKQDEINKQIDLEIRSKTDQLNKINEQIKNKTIDRSVTLSQVEIKVLDIYDRSSIKIPADIIEDLSYMGLGNEKDVFDFIENQRNFWKLENTKKPFKGVK